MSQIFNFVTLPNKPLNIQSTREYKFTVHSRRKIKNIYSQIKVEENNSEKKQPNINLKFEPKPLNLWPKKRHNTLCC